MSKSHVAFKLTPGGGPEPTLELKRVFEVAQDDPGGVSWIATRKPGAGFVQSQTSQLLAFAQLPCADALALTARVVSRRDVLPSDSLVRDMYESWRDVFRAYWKIADVRLRRVPFERLPGTTVNGLPIAEAFRSQLSFAYWLPPTSADLHHRPLPTAPRADEVPLPTMIATKPVEAGKGAVPVASLHGVDFSGAQESAGRNAKIWIASWYQDQEFVALECGGDDPGFDRIGLSHRILVEAGGTWVLDFPFGPATAVAAARGWRTWEEYLDWCGSNPDPTVLRDQLRQVLQDVGVRWSTPRRIDDALGTTWFPFFEQLYRQTITGARDVLTPLNRAGRDRTRVLPFHSHAAPDVSLSVIAEGFPGHTLTTLGLPRTGYKHRTSPGQEARARIVSALRGRGVPISDADAERATNDAEGDAVDALVLLHAARGASHRTAVDWASHPGIEGWFFD